MNGDGSPRADTHGSLSLFTTFNTRCYTSKFPFLISAPVWWA